MARSQPKNPTPDDIQTMKHLRQAGQDIQSIADEMGYGYGTVHKYLKGAEPVHKALEGWKEEGGSGTYTGITDKPIRTPAEALKLADLDPNIWMLEKVECTNWTVGMMPKSADKPVQTQQYRVRLVFKRIFSNSLQEATEALFQRLAKASPQFPPAFQKVAKVKGDCLAVMGLFDVHFGKFGWWKETGKDYDLKIAESFYENAVADLIAKVSTRRISRWLLPIGNDFYHMDNSRNTTFGGTPQDVDGRYAKVIEAGEMAVAKAIQKMAAVAPVDVVWVPGNHDPTTSYHLARFIWAYFSKCDAVTVDYGPSPRKYYRWERTLLGLTHGNEEKITELPNLMASEKPDDWAACKDGSKEWLIGHWHQSKQWVTKATDTSRETIIRGLMSLSGTDSWHHRKGYVHTSQAAEVYLYDKADGYCGHNVVYARQ